MATATADPWADPDETALAVQYPRMDDLMGRHLFIIPKEVQTKEGKPKEQGGEPESYDVVVSDVIILDGRKSEKIPSLPYIQKDFWVSGSKVVAELKAHMKKYPSGKPCLGFMEIRGRAFWFVAADPDVAKDPKTAMAWEAYQNPQAQQFAGPEQNQDPPF